MPKSEGTPTPSYYLVLLCLAVMLITAVKIWNQSSWPMLANGSGSSIASQADDQNLSSTATLTPDVASTGTEPARQTPRYGAEIRAEVVLAQSHSNTLTSAAPSVDDPTSPSIELFSSSNPSEGMLSLEGPSGPDAIALPLAVDAPPLDVLNPSRGLENPPSMVIPPLQPTATFAADAATPPLDRVATNIERVSPIGAPPTVVVAPLSPATISPAKIAAIPEPVTTPEPTVVPEPTATPEPAAIQPAEIKPAETALSLPKMVAPVLSDLPLPPVAAPNDVPNTQPVVIAPELPALAPEAPLAIANIQSEPAVEPVATVEPSEPAKSTQPSTDIRDSIQAARMAARSKQRAGDKLDAVNAKPSAPAAWPKMPALRSELKQLQAYQAQVGTEEVVTWATQIEQSVAELGDSRGLNTIDSMQPLRKLRYLMENTPKVANTTIQSRVMVARYAVQRRLAVWNHTQVAMHPEIQSKIAHVQSANDDELTMQLVQTIRNRLPSGQGGNSWAQFMRLDDVEGLAMSTTSRGSEDRAQVASQLLDRMNRSELTGPQIAIVQSPLAQQLQMQLRRWSTTEVNYMQWLAAIERLESNPSFRESNRLSDYASRLKWSYVPEHNQLASTFYSHYRNANTRLAITEAMLNQMLPVVRDSQTPVREQILGARVFGNSAAWTKIGVDLVPDNQRLRMKLIANGNVNMQTRSIKGPAVVFNRNQSHFHLQKIITYDQRGNVNIGKSNTTASTKLNVLGLRTEYDGVPLIGRMVRGKVRDEINASKNRARSIITSRVRQQAETMVDTQLTQQLMASQRQLEEKLVQPLRKLQLDPTTVSMQTTDQRVVYRGRLAAEHHLAAFTPRPNALANSVVSLQLHESTINNAIERMHVDGRRGDLREMLQQAADSRPSAGFKVPDDVPEGVTLALADEDAIRMRWHDGDMRISIRVAEIAFKRRSWKNFTVSANYRPAVNGLNAELYRDGVVELTSEKKLSMRDQVALRGIFGKVFSKNRNIPMTPETLVNDRRLADLKFTQFVIRDGWVGISIGRDVQNLARRRGNYRR